MTTSEIARTYAKVLFDLASAADAVDAADEGVTAVVTAVRGHIDLRDALADAQVPAEKKREVLREIFGASVAPEVLAIVTLAVERGHIALLGDVARDYREIAESQRGVVVAEITTAIALDESTRATIEKQLTTSLGRPVALRERVDESIVGGIVIKVAGRVLDGSLASQLDSMRATLSATPQGGEA